MKELVWRSCGRRRSRRRGRGRVGRGEGDGVRGRASSSEDDVHDGGVDEYAGGGDGGEAWSLDNGVAVPDEDAGDREYGDNGDIGDDVGSSPGDNGESGSTGLDLALDVKCQVANAAHSSSSISSTYKELSRDGSSSSRRLVWYSAGIGGRPASSSSSCAGQAGCSALGSGSCAAIRSAK